MSDSILTAATAASKHKGRVHKLPLAVLKAKALGPAALTLAAIKSWSHRSGGWSTAVTMTKLAASLGLKKRAVQLHLVTLRDAKYLLLTQAIEQLLRSKRSGIDREIAEGLASVLKLPLLERWAAAQEFIDCTAEVRKLVPQLSLSALSDEGLVKRRRGLELNRPALAQLFKDKGFRAEFLLVPWDVAASTSLTFDQKLVLSRALYRARFDGSFSIRRASRELGLKRDTVAGCLRELSRLGYINWQPARPGSKGRVTLPISGSLPENPARAA